MGEDATGRKLYRGGGENKLARVNKHTKAQIYESTNAMDLEMFLQIPPPESPLGTVYCQTHLHKNGCTVAATRFNTKGVCSQFHDFLLLSTKNCSFLRPFFPDPNTHQSERSQPLCFLNELTALHRTPALPAGTRIQRRKGRNQLWGFTKGTQAVVACQWLLVKL